MKLGILCTMINGFGRRGYYNSQEVGLGRALAAMGHELTIYKGIDPSEEEEKVVVVPGLVVWYLPMRHLGAHGWMPVSALDAETKALFCFGDQQLFLPHIYRWCKRHGAAFVPYIGTAHSLNDGPKGRLMNILFETGTLRIYKNNPVLAKTSAAKAELEALGVERITVAPVGLDTSVLKQDFRSVDRDALRREHGYAPEDVVLCNVSRLSPEKRPLELIDLFLKIRGKKALQAHHRGQWHTGKRPEREDTFQRSRAGSDPVRECTLSGDVENLLHVGLLRQHEQGRDLRHGHHGSCVLLHLGGGLPGHRTVGDAEGYEGPCSVRR